MMRVVDWKGTQRFYSKLVCERPVFFTSCTIKVAVPATAQKSITRFDYYCTKQVSLIGLLPACCMLYLTSDGIPETPIISSSCSIATIDRSRPPFSLAIRRPTLDRLSE